MDLWFEALENKLLAVFRGELLAAVTNQSAQTRALVFLNIGVVLSMAALAFGLVKFA
jgi:hypothetical protein